MKQGASALKVRVGRNLALAREALGRTQSQLAREYADFGITPPKLNQWEAGLHYPDPFFLAQLCDDYGFTMDWFYRGLKAGVSVERAADLRQAEAASPEPK